MNTLNRTWSLLLVLLLGSTPVWGQGGASSGADTLGGALRSIETNIWNIFGRVRTVRGEPLSDAVVRLRISAGAAREVVLRTNLRGEFRTELSLETDMYKRLNLKLIASKSGYAEARETVEFGATDKTSGIEMVLREASEVQDPDQLSMTALINGLAPRLRQDAAQRAGLASSRQPFERGCEQLIDRHRAVDAVPSLSKVVEREPSCVECRLLLSLALFDAGSWAGASRQLDEAARLNEAATVKRPETALIRGVLEAWRAENEVAAGLLLRALEIEPNHTLALQELGRVLIQQKNWPAADQYLDKAVRAGASEEARLLRVRALLEIGDIGEAAREMDRYGAGRSIKNLPLPARELAVHVREHLSVAGFGEVKSVITESPADLLKALPELRGMQAAADQHELEEILKRTGEGVAAFFQSFPSTLSLERVHQERLDKNGKVQFALDQEFQYLLLARYEKWGLAIQEHRSTAEGRLSELSGLNQGLMLTSGFTSASSIFHPDYQSGATFRHLGRQTLDGRDLHVVAFAQKPETARMMGRFITDQGSAVILTQGLAWIDSTTFQIVRLRTDLLNPLSNVRLDRQTTEIQFKQVSFKELATVLWLPQEVTVTVDWRGRTLRNLHRYSDFRLFNVETREEQRTPRLPEPAAQDQSH